MDDDESVTVVTSRRVRPADHAHSEYVVVFKFDSYDHLRAWTESAERKTWLDAVAPLVIDDSNSLLGPLPAHRRALFVANPRQF